MYSMPKGLMAEPSREELSTEQVEEVRSSRMSSPSLSGSLSQRIFSVDDEYELQWAALERLGTYDRLRTSVLDGIGSSEGNRKKKVVVDVTKLGAPDRRLLVDKLIKHIENDNLRLL